MFELNFFIRKTFLKTVKPGGENHPYSQACNETPGLKDTKGPELNVFCLMEVHVCVL